MDYCGRGEELREGGGALIQHKLARARALMSTLNGNAGSSLGETQKEGEAAGYSRRCCFALFCCITQCPGPARCPAPTGRPAPEGSSL